MEENKKHSDDDKNKSDTPGKDKVPIIVSYEKREKWRSYLSFLQGINKDTKNNDLVDMLVDSDPRYKRYLKLKANDFKRPKKKTKRKRGDN